MKKRIIAAVMACACLLGAASATYAATPKAEAVGIAPFWANVSSVTLTMSYSGGKVNCAGQLITNAGTKSIVCVYTLSKKDAGGAYSTVSTWTASNKNSTLLIASNSTTTPKGTYKLSVSAVVVSAAGIAETVTDSHEKTFT